MALATSSHARAPPPPPGGQTSPLAWPATYLTKDIAVAQPEVRLLHLVLQWG